MNLFEYFDRSKLLVLNNVAVRNGQHIANYTGEWRYLILKDAVKKAKPEYQDKIGKAMPAIHYHEIREFLEGAKSGRRKRIVHQWFNKRILIYGYSLFFIIPISFLRDRKLNKNG